MQRVGAAAGQRGYSLSKENTPFGTPRERRGETPSTPHIGSFYLEALHALRNRVQCTWLRHESSAIRYVSQPRLTIVRRE